ncbi:MAG TPA: sigma factor-like helix-turn-helix DNA-binding protein [Gemmataceae bacterium]|nr:sigma factor-like helix-turn-helix DNA-binding protein [Gemmataceae bacterium]
MQTHWVFNGCDEALKGHMRGYWEKKQPRLEKLLQHFRPDLQFLGLTVYRHAPPSGFEVRAALHLPSGTLVAEETEKDFAPALDRVADVLAREIKRHVERLRRDDLYRRKGRRRERLAAAGPFLERDAASGRRAAFFDLLRPQLSSLHDYARRELRLLELEGVLPKGEWAPADLVDEVLLLAWQRFGNRPRHKPLDLWLIDLLHECLERWRQQPPALSLAGQERDQGSPAEEEQEWWASLLGDTAPAGLEDLLPGSEGTEAWERLEAEEQRAQLSALLAALPKRQRQALVLHALEGFDPAEVAMVQDRPEKAVRADLDAGRQALRARMAEAGYLEAATTPAIAQAERAHPHRNEELLPK